MLEGYDKDWQNADQTRMASYAGIPGGTYRFRVKAFLLESPDKYDMRVIEVVVPPHPLLSRPVLWLYAILLLVALLAVLFWQRHRILGWVSEKKHGQSTDNS
jgi:hypothetical protein